MDLKSNIAAVRLIYDCMIREKADCEAVPFYPQKTSEPAMVEEPTAFAHVSPASVGFPTESVVELVRRVGADRAAGVHSLLVLVDGKCVCDVSSAGYSTRLPHMTFSMCKTVTGLAIGMLIDEGRLRLTDKLGDFFPEYGKGVIPKGRSARELTVQDLLTMSSGIPFTEAGAVLRQNWVRACLDPALPSASTRGFSYNSMNTYLLSAIVCRVTGGSLTQYLTPRLWEPLGIKDAFWELSPEGVEKGGWGLYLSPESMGKLGLLFMNEGKYNGRRIVSREWIARATRASMSVRGGDSKFDYGYQLWVHREGLGYLFNGMLGQNVWVYPRLGLVLVITAGDSHMLQDTSALRCAFDCLAGIARQEPRRERKSERDALNEAISQFDEESAWLPRYAVRGESTVRRELSSGGIFSTLFPEKNNAGLLALLHRLVQNNHTAGIGRIQVSEQDEVLTLRVTEGIERYEITAGLRRYIPSVLHCKGEKYRIAAAYALCRDEDRLPILKLELRFTELAYTRRIILRLLATGEAAMRLSETPGVPEIESVSGIATAAEGLSLLAPFRDMTAARRLAERMQRSFDQTLRLYTDPQDALAKKRL